MGFVFSTNASNASSSLCVLGATCSAIFSTATLSWLWTSEIIFVDDGSTDSTKELLEEISKTDKRVKLIFFIRNYGQTPAISVGIENSSGDIIITMDADLQNDPADIPILLKKIEEGYDVVSGWRKNRKDPFLQENFQVI
ncbi:MAG: glycosyltransferase family 2 protein [Endomicrobiia bacterium]